MKSRKQRRILRRTAREYKKIVGDQNLIQTPLLVLEPYKPGEVFQKFTLYDENRRSHTGIKTEYLG